MRHLFIINIIIWSFTVINLYSQPSPVLYWQLEDQNLVINGKSEVVQAWLLCPDPNGKQLELAGPKDPNISSCIWEVLDYNNHSNILCTSSIQIYNVHTGCGNTKTSIYKLKVIMKDGSVKYYYYVVYILEGINITETNGITECLEMGCDLNIHVKLLGIGMDKVNFVSSIGNIIMVASLNENNVAANYYSQLNFRTGLAEIKLLSKNLNKSFLTESVLTIYAFLHISCKSNELKINKYRMEITKFKHAKALKNFRVVVNEPIEFDVSGSQLITDFLWTMADEFFELGNNQRRSGTDMTMKREFGKMPQSNKDFGTTHGIVRIDCKLPSGTKVVFTSAKSKDPMIPYMINESTAQIYYRKNDKALDQEIIVGKDKKGDPIYKKVPAPNWFKYWTQFLPIDKSLIHYVFYNPNDSGSNNKGAIARPKNQPATGYQFNRQTLTLYQPVSESLGTLHGVHLAHSNSVHEGWHAALMGKTLWPNGYDRNLDKDPDPKFNKWDFYKDTFEALPKIKNYLSPKRDDNYSRPGSGGEKFEEKYAREEAESIKDKIHIFDLDDWSFEDRENFQKSQGKNWLKL